MIKFQFNFSMQGEDQKPRSLNLECLVYRICSNSNERSASGFLYNQRRSYCSEVPHESCDNSIYPSFLPPNKLALQEPNTISKISAGTPRLVKGYCCYYVYIFMGPRHGCLKKSLYSTTYVQIFREAPGMVSST